MRARYAKFVGNLSCPAGEYQPGGAVGVVLRGDIREPNTSPNTTTERLSRGLLDRKALRDQARRLARALKLGPFAGRKQTLGQARAEAFVQREHPLQFDDIDTETDDHGMFLASRIRRFISETACARPVLSARATIA